MNVSKHARTSQLVRAVLDENKKCVFKDLVLAIARVVDREYAAEEAARADARWDEALQESTNSKEFLEICRRGHELWQEVLNVKTREVAG